MSTEQQQHDNQWRPIGEAVGAGDVPVEVIESLCMECHEQGETRMLLTVIPYFREVIVVSFRCEHCGYKNNEIQSAGEIQPLGAIYTVKCTSRDDLNRQLVKSEHCTISIPEYQLTIPQGRGQFTTVEGVIADTVRDLLHDQPLRKIQHPDLHDKIAELVAKLRVLVPDVELDPLLEDDNGEANGAPVAGSSDGAMPTFTIKLDDPSGNSFVETRGGLGDPKWAKREYGRDRAQDEALGLKHDEATDKATSHYPEEVLSFPGVCSLCGSELETLMKKVNIPHFKDIILMSTNCHDCGYRDTEVKSGGAIADKGRKITLKVEESDDLSRDILKSETAGLYIPEIDLELNPGTLGGRFTTLEGLLQQVYEELDGKAFAHGDAADKGAADEMQTFLGNLKKAMAVETPFTVVLDDPLANSFIQSLYAPDPDPSLTQEDYERSHFQNEELGLNDINVDNYGHVEVPEGDGATATAAAAGVRKELASVGQAWRSTHPHVEVSQRVHASTDWVRFVSHLLVVAAPHLSAAAWRSIAAELSEYKGPIEGPLKGKPLAEFVDSLRGPDDAEAQTLLPHLYGLYKTYGDPVPREVQRALSAVVRAWHAQGGHGAAEKQAGDDWLHFVSVVLVQNAASLEGRWRAVQDELRAYANRLKEEGGPSDAESVLPIVNALYAPASSAHSLSRAMLGHPHYKLERLRPARF